MLKWTGQHNALLKAPTFGRPLLSSTREDRPQEGVIIPPLKIRGGEEGL